MRDLFFFLACNPYRMRPKGNDTNNYIINKNQKNKLVYKVNPLPLSLLNFIIDFGTLKKEDEENYIKNKIKNYLNEIFQKENKNEEEFFERLVSIGSKCVIICHYFIKEKNELSIINLKDVNKFLELLNFFSKFLFIRKDKFSSINNDLLNNEILEFYKDKSEFDLYCYSINLSLYICYYLKLIDKESRNQLVEILNKENFFGGDFLKLPLIEQNYLINNLQIDNGISKNNTLKENLFISFFCIINKLPIITLGKSGTSKSLAIKILQSSMKGSLSKSSLCKQYPELFLFKIHGNLNTTSKEVSEIFVKAKNCYKSNTDKLIVVLFENMGITEDNADNPLKIIHSQIETKDNQIIFIGTSNWILDPSIMNKVIYNIVQEPDETDIINSVEELIKSYEIKEDKLFEKYKNNISKVCKAYFLYKKNMEIKNEKDYEKNFHGISDLYSLIKSIMNDIIKYKGKILEDEEENNYIEKICMFNIERNFGGLKNSIQNFKDNFIQNYQYNSEYNILKCIKNNINDESSRFILLVLENYISKDLFNYLLKDIYEQNFLNDKKDDTNFNIINEDKKRNPIIKYFYGSKFKLDKKNKLYSKSILNQIKYEMKTENIIILKDLNFIYAFLYDLFDQNSIYLENKKFVKIGMSKSLSLLNNKFKIILLEDKENISKLDSTFLKYFEKHIISFSNLLNDELNAILNEIIETLTNILKYDTNDNIINKLQKHLFFINKDAIKSLVYLKSKELEKIDKNKIILTVLEKITPFLSEELMVLICKYNFKNCYNYYFESIYDIYKKQYCYNLNNYLEQLNNEISIIYTFSLINRDIMDNLLENNDQFIQNNTFNITFRKCNTKEINVSSFYSITKLEKKIINFIFEDDAKKKYAKKNLLIIKFKEKDINKINDIYYLIKELKSNYKSVKKEYKNKIIIFIVNISKKYNTNNTKNIEYILETPQIFINDLYNKHKFFLDLLLSTNKDIINNNLININEIIKNNINSILRFFNYNLINSHNNFDNYKEKINQFITKDELLKIIIKCIINFSENDEDFLINTFNDKIINNENQDNFLIIFYNNLNEKMFVYLTKIIFLLEKQSIINTILFNSDVYNEEIIKKYVNSYISTIYKEELIKFNWENPYLDIKINFDVIIGKELPLTTQIYENLINFIESNISYKYIEAETSFIYKNIKNEKYNEERTNYLNKIKELNNKLELEVSKYEIMSEIFSSNNKILINGIFKDFFLIYIYKQNINTNNFTDYSILLDLIIQLRIIYTINKGLDNGFFTEKKINLKKSIIEFVEMSEENNEKENLDISEQQYSYINLFVEVLNFLVNYSKELKYILEIYRIILKFEPNSLNELKDIIINRKIEIDDDGMKYKCFFYIIEALMNIFNIKINTIIKNTNKFNERNEIFKLSQFFFQNISKLEKRFLVKSKEILCLKINIKFINHCDIKKIAEKEELKTIYNIMKYISNNMHMKNKDADSNFKNLTTINNLLNNIFGKTTDKYCEIMNNILLNQYQYDPLVYNQENIIKILLPEDNKKTNELLIVKSYPLIQAIFDFESFELKINNEENHEISNEKLKKNFLSFCKKSNFIKEYINNRNNVQLNKVILYHFEITCNNYFKKIIESNFEIKKNLYKNLFCGMSKVYLEESLNYLDNETSKKKNDGLNIIGKLFCIAYIKRYLIYYVDTLMSNDFQYLDERSNINKLLFEKNVLIRKVIKYYILKICYEKNDYNYDKLNDFFNSDEIFGFKEYFNEIHLTKKNIQVNMPFFLLDLKKDDFNKYETLLSNNKKNQINLDEIYNFFIKTNSYDYFYTFLANISLLSSYEKKIENKHNSFASMLDIVFNYFHKNNCFKNESKICLKYSFEKNTQRLKYEKLEILFYSFRFIFNLLVNKKNNNIKPGFYYNLLTNEVELTLKNNFIPGNFPNEIVLIKYFPEIKKYLTSNQDKDIILCSCGYFSKDDNIQKCQICGESLNEKDDNNQGNKKKPKYKILYNEAQKKGFFSIFSGKNKNIIEMSLNDLERKINNEKNIVKKNISPPLKNIFFLRNDKIREIDELTYRFLNFLLYSFLFYSSLIGNIKNTNQKNYWIENLNLFEIMEKDWEIMDEIVKDNNIQNIQIFFHMIYSSINSKLVKDINKNFYNEEDAIKFEKEINNIIKNIINEEVNNNKMLMRQYIMQNNILLNVEPFSEKSIISETEPSEIYSKDNYPEIEYFTKSKLPSKENFIKAFNDLKNKEKYPIINIIINNEELKKKLKLLQYLPITNEICNYMIKYCSFRYSREEAKKVNIENEIEDPDKKKLIKKFYKIYKIIRPYAKNFDCHNLETGFNNLENEPYLSNFCVDTNEVGYGMVLACIYKTMIEVQNSFIDNINKSSNEQLKYYANLFIIEKMIQDCHKDEIVNLPSFDDDNNKDKNEIEKDNEINDIYDNDNDNNDEENINLMKIIIDNSFYYKNNYLEYNFDSIEDTLGSLILPNIKRFYSPQTLDNYLRTVIYQYEGFIRNKKNIITEYTEKYQQRELSEIELNIVINYILKEQKNQNFNIKNVLFSLQILIDTILSNNYMKNESLYKIIVNIEDNSNLSIIKNFFNKIKSEVDNNNTLFTVECLIDLMNLFEKLCWDKIRNNLNKDYLIDINDDIKTMQDKNYNNNKLFISKELLCTAIRRFISRYLIGKNEENKINPKNNLYQYLDKDELWPINFTKNEKFKQELQKILTIKENNYISVEHSMKLYDYLGGDLNSLEEFIKKKKEADKIYENKDLMKLKEGNDNDKNDRDNYNIIKNMNDSQIEDKISEINDSKSDVEENEEDEEQSNESSDISYN